MTFHLHPNLSQKAFIIDLPLSRVLLEDNSHYPWIFLVPRRNAIGKIIDLTSSDQLQLIQELDLAQKILWDIFSPSQINVAAIGNKTPQLHIHVIARFSHDPAWPGTVWDHPASAPYSPEKKEQIIREIASSIRDGCQSSKLACYAL